MLSTESQALHTETAYALLGIREPVPLTVAQMKNRLRVCFFMAEGISAELGRFLTRLMDGFHRLGVTVLDIEQAVSQGSGGKIPEGMVMVAAGDFSDGRLPIDLVSSLSKNTTVGVYERPSPLRLAVDQQSRMNALVHTMAWDMVQVAIYLDGAHWTVCNMNGAMVELDTSDDVAVGIEAVLLSKLAAPVIPPKLSDFELCPSPFDARRSDHQQAVCDMLDSGVLWRESGLFLYQTELASLRFRNKFYRRLGTAFLDHRSGMSYGFLARQLPLPISAALTEGQARERLGTLEGSGRQLHDRSGAWYVSLRVSGQTWIVPVPEAAVLCTRSGCSKTHLNPSRDILRMGLDKGRLTLELPANLDPLVDCKPSYDSTLILAHALGNALIASVLLRLQPDNRYLQHLLRSGLGIAHWHGYLSPAEYPAGYTVYGASNIPFSCSTPQSAVLALQCKIDAFVRHFERHGDYIGDVHIEPHHGTNMVGESLTAMARQLSLCSVSV